MENIKRFDNGLIVDLSKIVYVNSDIYYNDEFNYFYCTIGFEPEQKLFSYNKKIESIEYRSKIIQLTQNEIDKIINEADKEFEKRSPEERWCHYWDWVNMKKINALELVKNKAKPFFKDEIDYLIRIWKTVKEK